MSKDIKKIIKLTYELKTKKYEDFFTIKKLMHKIIDNKISTKTL